MREKSSFSTEPDADLGALLREALTGPAPDAFMARLEAAVRGVSAERDQWDTLARWARPRVALAAAAAAFLLGLGVWRHWSKPGPEPESVALAAAEPQGTVASPGVIWQTVLLEGR
ncbi:MAG: hypothetical protein ABI647_00635 [Gemmatimonadota bacterium]